MIAFSKTVVRIKLLVIEIYLLQMIQEIRMSMDNNISNIDKLSSYGCSFI